MESVKIAVAKDASGFPRLYASREGTLCGLRILVYMHSAVGGDFLVGLLSDLGATVEPVLKSAHFFIGVDTEALENVDKLAALVTDYRADVLVSADADGDRPLLMDENGRIVRGDEIGPLVARELGADVVVTPVTSNTAVERCGWFEKVVRTKVGSPYVIEAMKATEESMSSDDELPAPNVVGYEANGGFLTPDLPTRDAVLPLLVMLQAAKRVGSVSKLVNELPQRRTASCVIDGIGPEVGAVFVRDRWRDVCNATVMGASQHVDFTDGVRVRLEQTDEIIHLRQSGNGPQLRCYTEAETEERARELLEAVATNVRILLEKEA